MRKHWGPGLFIPDIYQAAPQGVPMGKACNRSQLINLFPVMRFLCITPFSGVFLFSHCQFLSQYGIHPIWPIYIIEI